MDSPVLATITQEELEQIRSMEYEAGAISLIQDDIVTRLAKLTRRRESFWKDVEEKYGLSDKRLHSINRETGEITTVEEA